jgi:polycomb group RING finger protein 3
MIKVSLKELNPLITCQLCNGYYREAHTITDCMHTFCKSCLLDYFNNKSGSKRGYLCCPTCKADLGSSTFSTFSAKFIYDRNMQAVVDKIFPHFAKQELEYARNKTKRQNETGAVKETNKSAKVSNDSEKEVTIKLFPVNKSENVNIDELLILPALKKPSLKASLSVQIAKLQKFIHKRLDPEVQHGVEFDNIEILYNGKTLNPTHDLTSLQNDLAPTCSTIILAYKKYS